ncbi:cytochrome c oxidase subunit 4 [Streptomyces sp. NPDC057257]|uniref:aa3-type cytochrome oxidase subunit IV n=1 Tax=Streptomyces sp. NPDC057257 TaxID=3346071 RepID=UPI00363DC8C7
MKSEALLFAGVAAFFLVADTVYAWFSREPAGIAALTVSFVMSSLIAFFSLINYRRKGARPEDRPSAEIRERGGRIGFFPPHSRYPVVTALGVTTLAIGVVYGLWLFLIGFGLLAVGVSGLVFEYAERESV